MEIISEARKPAASNSQGACAWVSVARTSSESDGTGNCAQVGVLDPCRKSSESQWNGGCAQVATGSANRQVVVVVTNDNPKITGRYRGPVHFTPAEWRAFIAGVKNGEFDLDAGDRLPPVTTRG